MRIRTPLGAMLLLALAIAVIAGPFVMPFTATQPDFAAALSPPDARHWMGTDSFGRDVLARTLEGGRVSMLVALLSVTGALAAGAPLGFASGFFGGVFDRVTMRCMDVLLAFPGILLALGLVAALGASAGQATLAIGIINLPVIVRIARGQALVLRGALYIDAARAAGRHPGAILLKTLAPNAMSPLIVQAATLVASSMLTEATLSFLGLGVQPPTPSWGNMLRDAFDFIDQAEWLAWFPGTALFLAVLGATLFGDGLTERLDPRSRQI